MTKKLIDFKKASNDSLIKLWIEHYKEYADDATKKLLTKQETQELYDEAYKRGLGSRLILLYNAIYLIHISVRQDINNGATRFLAIADSYFQKYKMYIQISELYTREALKAITEEEKAYRDKVATFLLKNNYLDDLKDDKTVGEDILENNIKSIKSSLLLCKKAQQLTGLDIISAKSKDQINTGRQMIKLLIADITNNIDELKYWLGLTEEQKKKGEIPSKDFYDFIEKTIGVELLERVMQRLADMLARQARSKENLEATARAIEEISTKKLTDKEREKELKQASQEIDDEYPIEATGLNEEDLAEVDRLIEVLRTREGLM